MASLTPRLDQVDFNLLINGSMDYWQRGTTFTASSNVYGADRWKHNIISSHWQVLRSTNIPVVENIQYSYQADCTATASPAAADQEMIEQFIEQNIARKLVGKKARLIFWVSSPKTGLHNVYFNNPNGTYAYLAPYTITAANTWQKIVLDIDFSSMPATIPAGTSNGMVVGFPLAVGTNRVNASSGTWLSGDYKILSGAQSNLLDNTANNFYVTGVMLIPYTATLTNPPNPDAYIYAGRDIVRELALCQRYFEKSYDVDVAVDTLTVTGCEQYITQGANSEQRSWGFRVMKRTTPTMSQKDPVSGSAGQVDRARNVTDNVQVFLLAENQSQHGFGTQTAVAAGKIIRFQWTAEAEL